jgi:iron-sulfur cluster assembly protein
LITVTGEAARQIQDVLTRHGWQGYGLRFGLRDGGCSGYTYLLDFEAAPEAEDLVHEEHGVRVFIHPMHLPFVMGSTIGWKGDLWEKGFQVDNPNVKRLCGCGESFDV